MRKKIQTKPKSSVKSKKSSNDHIVKRHGRSEKFDSKKVYAAVYAAALNAHYGERAAEKLAGDVMKKVTMWAKKEDTIFSIEIRYQILKHITDEEVALMYTHHLDIC